jgi:hypothetical protein
MILGKLDQHLIQMTLREAYLVTMSSSRDSETLPFLIDALRLYPQYSFGVGIAISSPAKVEATPEC